MEGTYYRYRLTSEAIRRAPQPAVVAVRRVVGLWARYTERDRRLLIKRNLRRVRGPGFTGRELRRATTDAFAAYARYWTESARLPDLSSRDVDAGFSYDGFEHVEDSVAAGRGTILALPHLGGWEWAGAWLAQIPRYRVVAVAEPLEPPELFEWMIEVRRAYGLEIIPLGSGAGPQLVRSLRANAVVCLLCDRNVGQGGIEVEFFGERTELPGGPATLALRTGASIIPVAVYHRRHGQHAVARPPVQAAREGRLRDDVHRVTAELARELEILIRAAPEQWHLMQPNWPSDYLALNGGPVNSGAVAGRPTPVE